METAPNTAQTQPKASHSLTGTTLLGSHVNEPQMNLKRQLQLPAMGVPPVKRNHRGDLLYPMIPMGQAEGDMIAAADAARSTFKPEATCSYSTGQVCWIVRTNKNKTDVSE